MYLAIAEKGLCEEMVVTFPLTHEPAEFVLPDGTIQTTTKRSVTYLFDLVKIGPKEFDSIIINGIFLSRNLTVPLPHTLRGLVQHILIKALKMSKQKVDFVLDTYNSPCLRDIIRNIRGDNLDDSDEIYSFGSGQNIPSNFLNLLKYSNFKKAFLHFFYQEIQKNEYENIFDHKVFIALLIMNAFVYSAMKKECYRWRMFMTYMALTMKLIHVLLFMQYTLNN